MNVVIGSGFSLWYCLFYRSSVFLPADSRLFPFLNVGSVSLVSSVFVDLQFAHISLYQEDTHSPLVRTICSVTIVKECSPHNMISLPC